MSSHTVTRDASTIVSLVLTSFFPDHAKISAATPATSCLCYVLNRKIIHEKLSQHLSRIVTEVDLSETKEFCESLHTIYVIDEPITNRR